MLNFEGRWVSNIICAAVCVFSFMCIAYGDPLLDSDNDGMPDEWEIIHSLNPQADDSQADPDNDGLSNFYELQYSTNPRNSDTDNDGLSDGEEIFTEVIIEIGFSERVNAYKPHTQARSAIASNEIQYLTAWSSYAQDGSGWGIYAQYLNGAGNDIGSEFRVNSLTLGHQFEPQVASDGKNYFIVWESENLSGDKSDVYGTIKKDDGTTVTSEFRINSSTASHHQNPHIASNGQSYCVVWHDEAQDEDGWDIYAAMLDNEGSSIIPEFKVNSYTQLKQDSPSAASNGSSYFVVWSSEVQDGNGYGVFGRLFNGNGQPLTDEFQLNTSTLSDQYQIKAASNGQNYAVVWTSKPEYGNLQNIYAAMLSPAGSIIVPEFKLNENNTANNFYPSIFAYNSFMYIALWQTESRIMGQVISTNGLKLGDPFVMRDLPDSTGTFTAGASDAQSAIVLWREGGGVPTDIFSSVLTLHSLNTANPINPDTDNDGVSDGDEVLFYGTSPANSDTDNDGLSDGAEVFIHNTSPTAADSDNDGMPDEWEIIHSLNPLANNSLDDPDNDGVSNLIEFQNNVNPHSSDTDNDGLSDGDEILSYGTSPANPDSDNDGISDGDEVFIHNTSPTTADTDNDGMPDEWEIIHSLNPQADDSQADPDNDGLSNFYELQYSANPRSSDTDNDGLLDGEEVTFVSPKQLVSSNFSRNLAAANENYLIIRKHEDDDQLESIRGQFVDFNGNPIGNEKVLVSPFTLKRYSSDSSVQPTGYFRSEGIASDGSNYYIVWTVQYRLQSIQPSTKTQAMFVQRFDSLGNAIHSPVEVDSIFSSRYSYGSYSLLSTIDSQKQLWILYAQYDQGEPGNTHDYRTSIIIRGFDENLIPITPPKVIMEEDDYLSTGYMQIEASNKILLLVYDSWGSNQERAVFAQKINLNGSLIGDPYKISATSSHPSRPAVKFNGNHFLVTWTNRQHLDEGMELGVHGQILDQYGNKLGPEITLSKMGVDNFNWEFYNTLLAFNGSNFLLSWVKEYNDSATFDYSYSVSYLLLNKDGIPISEEKEFGPQTYLGGLSTNDDTFFALYQLDSKMYSQILWAGTNTDPLNPDSDNDGISDADELNQNTNPLVADADNDGISDIDEVNLDTNPQSSDSDNDGLPDKWEVAHGFDPLSDDTAADADNDGSSNGDEFIRKTHPRFPDTDLDGLSDGDEQIHSTNPLWGDTDNDGISDGEEILLNLNPLLSDTDNDGYTDLFEINNDMNPNADDRLLDSDNDTLSDHDEILIHLTSAHTADTDNDGLTDSQELFTYGTDPLDGDTDNDGLSDDDEVIIHNTNPLQSDTDNDGLSDSDEITSHSTNPLIVDTDNDTAPDGWEINHGYNPNVAELSIDNDGDTLNLYQELLHRSDPNKADTDNDTIPDGVEVFTYHTDPAREDTDFDTLPDPDELFTYYTMPNKADSDNDGLYDGAELTFSGTNPLVADTDNDGLLDGEEMSIARNLLLSPEAEIEQSTWNGSYSSYLWSSVVYDASRTIFLPHYNPKYNPEYPAQHLLITPCGTDYAVCWSYDTDAQYDFDEESSQYYSRFISEAGVRIDRELVLSNYFVTLGGSESDLAVMYRNNKYKIYNRATEETVTFPTADKVIENADLVAAMASDGEQLLYVGQRHQNIYINSEYGYESEWTFYASLVDAQGTINEINLEHDTSHKVVKTDVAYGNNQYCVVYQYRSLQSGPYFNDQPFYLDDQPLIAKFIGAQGQVNHTKITVFTTQTELQRLAVAGSESTYFIVWDVGSQNYGKIIDSNGDTIKDTFPFDGDRPDVACNGDVYMVIWYERDDNDDILLKAQFFSLTGEPLRDAMVIFRNDEYIHNSNCISNGSNFSIVWSVEEFLYSQTLNYAVGSNPLSADTDNDGLLDGWEVEHGYNPLENDFLLDDDNDGLTNAFELNLGTDIHNADTDNDGLSDNLEVSEFGTSFRINSSIPSNQTNPSAGEGQDAYLVAWQSDEPDNPGVFGKFISDDLAVFGEEFQLDTPQSGTHKNPSVGTLFSRDEYMVVWETHHQGEAKIYGQRIKPSQQQLHAELGNTAFTSINNFPSNLLLYWGNYEAQFTGKSTGVWMNVNRGSGASFSIAFYTDTGAGRPGAKVAETQQVTVTNQSSEWIFFPFAEPAEVQKGEKYWFGWGYEHTQQVHLNYAAGPSDAAFRASNWTASQGYPAMAQSDMSVHESRAALYLEYDSTTYTIPDPYPPVELVSVATNNDLLPNIMFISNQYHLVWQESDGIYIRLLDNEGTPLYEPAVIVEESFDVPVYPRIASVGPFWCVAWQTAAGIAAQSFLLPTPLIDAYNYLGRRSEGNSQNNFPPGDLYFWGSYQPAASSTSQGVWLNIFESNGAVFSIGVYEGNGLSHPGIKVGETEKVTVPANESGWVFFPFPEPLLVENTKEYWFSWTHTTAAHVHLYYEQEPLPTGYRCEQWDNKPEYPLSAPHHEGEYNIAVGIYMDLTPLEFKAYDLLGRDIDFAERMELPASSATNIQLKRKGFIEYLVSWEHANGHRTQYTAWLNDDNGFYPEEVFAAYPLAFEQSTTFQHDANKSFVIRQEKQADNTYDIMGSLIETGLNTNPLQADTDNDGLSDRDEVTTHHTDPTMVDSDNDDISDKWELAYGTGSSNPDTDNDGAKDGIELGFGANPLNPDTDNDGIKDGWEIAHNIDPVAADTDNDGQNDRFEVVAGSNPRDAQSRFYFGVSQAPDSCSQLMWNCEPGKRYQVVVGDDLFNSEKEYIIPVETHYSGFYYLDDRGLDVDNDGDFDDDGDMYPSSDPRIKARFYRVIIQDDIF